MNTAYKNLLDAAYIIALDAANDAEADLADAKTHLANTESDLDAANFAAANANAYAYASASVYDNARTAVETAARAAARAQDVLADVTREFRDGN